MLMTGVLGRLRRWWAAPQPTPAAYEVACACGETARGARLPEPQVISCRRCGAELFVLPRSCLPPVTASAAPGSAAVARGGKRPWLLPLAAGLLTAAALVVVYLLVLVPLTNGPPRPDGSSPGPAIDVAERLDAVRRQIRLGHFRLAVEELKSLEEQARRRPDNWSRLQLRDLRSLARQAELLADLLAEPLEEVLHHAAEVQDREWQVEFRQRYQGRAVVFDMEVRPRGDGRHEHDWRLVVRGKPAHLDLGDLELLARLPAERPPRLLFGGRLASVRQDPGRGWVVRLEPDSGVLITDSGAALACFVAPEEADVVELLRRQAEWAQRDAP
jgi:hypothetical protein